MAQIGTFTRAEDGSYTGTIKTLSLNFKARFLPAEPSENEKAPNLRVVVGNVEIGAAWQRTSKDNTVYHSVKLDDPSFPAPIYANLAAVDDGYALVWSRCPTPLRRLASREAPRLLSTGLCGATQPQKPLKTAATSKRLRIIPRYA